MTSDELGLVVEPVAAAAGTSTVPLPGTLEVGSFMNTIGCSGGSLPVSAACLA